MILLVESFSHKYIDLYYEKMVYLDFLPIAHQFSHLPT